MQVVLASSSPYRKALLERILDKFECCSPNSDEGLESAVSLSTNVINIASRKAHAVASEYPQSLIIASDQLCSINQQVIGKPHTFDGACQQLRKASGQSVVFYTALVVLNTITHQQWSHCDETSVLFRNLSDQEIAQYVRNEKPYDCAGSFKVESMGVTLFRKVINEDPTALIGLPLIKLCELLRENGIEV